MITPKRKIAVSAIVGLVLPFFFSPAYSGSINFEGPLTLVLEDTGGGVYSGTPVGTSFSGFIDDLSFGGQISNGTTVTPFTCCIAAGGLIVGNDNALSADDAALINSLLGAPVYNAGDIIDSIDIETDAATAGGGRIEIGVSYLFAPGTFNNSDPSNYPFDPNDVVLAIYFIFEEDINGVTVYDAIGLNNSLAVSSAVCDIQMNQLVYFDGDTVTANVFRFANLSGADVATELKIWLGVPGVPPISITNLGADGSFVLPPGTDIDLGPVPLFPATGLPSGEYELSCRMLEPVTGELLYADLNPFQVSPAIAFDMTQRTATSVITFSECPGVPLGWNYSFSATQMTLVGSDGWNTPACTTDPQTTLVVDMTTIAPDFDIPFNCSAYPICTGSDFNKTIIGVDQDNRPFTSTYSFDPQTNVLTYIKAVEGTTFTEVITIQ